jgi:hypothetical protein
MTGIPGRGQIIMKWKNLILAPEVRLIDVDEIETMLSGSLPDELVEEYYRFGSLLLSEVQNMASQIDGKLTTVLGLASGMVVFLLFGTALKGFDPVKTWVSVAAAAAFLALVVAAYGLMTRPLRLPSARDWFKEGLRDQVRLKKYHIVSLLAAQQQHVKLIGPKINCLRIAELVVALSAIVVIGILLSSVLS